MNAKEESSAVAQMDKKEEDAWKVIELEFLQPEQICFIKNLI